MVLLISIIKIIGIIVLIIAALVLMLIAAVLFVPLRYRIEGSFHDEKPCGSASVKWMLGVLGFRASYSGEEGVQAYISLFGRRIYDLLDDDSGEDGTDENAAGDGNDADEAGPDSEAGSGRTATRTAEISSELKDSNGNADVLPAAKQPLPDDKIGDTAKEDRDALSDDTQNAAEAKISNGNDSISHSVCEGTADTSSNLHAELLRDDGIEPEKTEAGKNNGNVFYRIAEKINSFRLPDFAAVRNGIFMKLRYVSDKISAAVDSAEKKLTELAKRLIEIVKALKKAFDKRSGQLNDLIELWKDEKYQASEKLLISRIVRLLKELKPRKGHGQLRLGFGDPYTTGQAMQLAALLYPLYGDRIEVIPDFDRSVIDGEGDLKGRIRLIVPAEAAVRIFLDKGLKSMYKQARGILELD